MIQLALNFENVTPVTACAVEGSVEITRHKVKYLVPREFVDSEGVRYIYIGKDGNKNAHYIGSDGHSWHYDPEKTTLSKGVEQTWTTPAMLITCSKAYVRIWYQNRRSYAHRVVAQFFLNGGEPIPPGMEVDHLDGDHRNNSLSNLEIVTREENIRRRNLKHGWKHLSAHARKLSAERSRRRRARIREKLRTKTLSSLSQ